MATLDVPAWVVVAVEPTIALCCRQKLVLFDIATVAKVEAVASFVATARATVLEVPRQSRGRFLQMAKRNWRRGRISQYLAAVVVRVAAVIAVAGGLQGSGDEGACSCAGKSTGSVAGSDGGNSATEAAVV